MCSQLQQRSAVKDKWPVAEWSVHTLAALSSISFAVHFLVGPFQYGSSVQQRRRKRAFGG